AVLTKNARAVSRPGPLGTIEREKPGVRMMKRQFTIFVACGIVATALACGDNKSSNPAAPSSPGGVTEGATADGSTLKVTAPEQVSPANGSTLEDNSVPLRINASTAKFTSSS